jgi:phosphate transport system substrate-binding protein
MAEIGYIADGDRWLFIAHSAIVRFFSPVHPDPIVDDVAIADETDIDLVDVEEESKIVLTPRTSQWADVSWEISETEKAALHQQGGSQLVVRLYDVTGIDLSYQNPQLFQQYECDETAHDRFVEIPISDRDYIAEIGYITDGDHWLFIARSAIVRVFSPVSTDSTVEDVALASETATNLVNVEEESSQEESKILLTPRTPKWAYVSWNISPIQNQALQQQGGSQLVVRLYDVTGIDFSYQNPQLVQQYECEEVARDRFVAIPVSDRDYMVEIGYVADSDRWLLIARSPNVRVLSRSHEDFWFVADAELIIHGATQPNTSVNIGGHTIKIKPDGTFHLRLPFSDGLMDYLITVAADGESTRTIHKKFSQETSES